MKNLPVLTCEEVRELLDEGKRISEAKKRRQANPRPSYTNYGVRFDTSPRRYESFVYPTQPLRNHQSVRYGRRFNWWKTPIEDGPSTGWVTNPRNVDEDPILTWQRNVTDPVNFKINVHPWRNARV